ncbi:MAG: hypothetical protein CMJ62_08140 [Planctomycetaceae bacterium]|nr:hypothetical protein [Planctomycetaceae bacterium]
MSTDRRKVREPATIHRGRSGSRSNRPVVVRGRTGARSVFLITALLTLLTATSPVTAINIVLNFDDAQSTDPTFDSTGALLQPIFEHAETFYQGVFQDTAANTTLTINYWYEDLTGGLIGLHSLVSETTSGGTLPNREVTANIRIDTLVGTGGAERNWFIDTTPDDDDEYTMGQTLWRDLTAAQRTDLFNAGADIPDTFETSYTGTAVAESAAVGATDMVTVVLHEVGHALGMSSSNNATVAETGDNDYDFNSDFVFGKTLAVEVADGGSVAHLDSSGLFMMDPSPAPSGTRRRPSHSDLFAMAAGHSYTSLDVPRREFYRPAGGGNWNNSANWSGDEVPESADDVNVRDNRPDGTGDFPTANLTADGNAANLTVAESANVDTEEFKLDVVGTITVTDTNSDLFIRDGGEAEAETLTVTNDAEVHPETGGLIDVDQLKISDDSLLIGAGEVNVQTELENDGTITASGGTLTLTTSNPGGVFDLDGFFFQGSGPIGIFTEPGKVNATAGDIVVDGQLTDGFNGTMTVSSTRAITFQDDWELASFSLLGPSNGVLNLTEGTVAGPGKMTAQGILNVSTGTGNGISYINSPVDFGSQVDVNVNAGAELEINGAATVSGGTYNIDDDGLLEFDSTLSIGSAAFNDVGVAGTADVRFDGITTYTGGTINSTVPLYQQGNLAVNGATVVNGTIVNLDGGGATTVTLNDDLTINSDSLDSYDNVFNGTLNINNPGRLTVSTTEGSWTMAGEMNLDQNAHAARFVVLGDDINISGQMTVTGTLGIKSTAHISGSITLGDPGYLFQLGGGDNTISGGDIAGPGRLVAVGTNNNNSLAGFGTISADIEFSGGEKTDLWADGGTLSLSGTILEVDEIGTASGTGTLDVVNAWNTSVAGELQLNGGEVTGGGITNDGTTIGHGLITSSSFVNNSTLTADGGTLTLDTGSFPDLDGSSETGTVNALDGSVEVLNASVGNFVFDGTLNVGVGQMFRLSARGLTNDGVVNLANGTVAATDFSQDAQLNVSAGGPSRLEAPGIDFEWGGTSTIEDDLELMGATDIYAGAIFAGSGQLVVPAGAVLNLKDGALVGVGIENNGQVAVGSSPGLAVVGGDYSQSGGSLLEMEIEGTTAGTEYDQLVVTGTASLDGTLDIPVNVGGGSYTDPATRGDSDTFSLVDAGGRAGSFSAVHYDGSLLAAEFTSGDDFRDHVGLGLFRNVSYTATSVELQNLNALAGDTDGDMDVDLQDYNTLAGNFSPTSCIGCDWVDGDFDADNDIDLSDYNALSRNFSPIGYGAASAVPEPSTMMLSLFALLSLVSVVARHKR